MVCRDLSVEKSVSSPRTWPRNRRTINSYVSRSLTSRIDSQFCSQNIWVTSITNIYVKTVPWLCLITLNHMYPYYPHSCPPPITRRGEVKWILEERTSEHWSKVFPVAIHFHPAHSKLKPLTDSFNTLQTTYFWVSKKKEESNKSIYM